MYFNRRCKITFICHGATIHSEEGRFSDLQEYPPISDLGEEEMNNLIKYLKAREIKNDNIYSSPSLRAQQSAQMLSKTFKQDYEIIDNLTPRKCGGWNGLTYSDILSKYPNGISEILASMESDDPSSGENSILFVERIKNVINNLTEKNRGNRIIIVTHPDIIQAAICGALNLNADNLLKIYIRTGSATQISYYENWASLVYCDHVPQ